MFLVIASTGQPPSIPKPGEHNLKAAQQQSNRVIGSDDAAAAVDRLYRASPTLELVMLAPADALSPVLERADESPWRRAVARPAQDRREVSRFDKCEIGREAYPLHDHGPSVVWASAWLAFYVIVSIHYFIA